MSVSSESQNIVVLFPEQKVERDLPTEDLLQELAEEIRDRSRSTTAAVIAIGVALARGKERIKHGGFAKWAAEQCGFTARTAQNYMLAAALAAKYEIVSLLTPAALYRLAAPKTSEGVVNAVVRMLSNGNVPTEPEIVELIKAQQAQRDESRPSVPPQNHEEASELALALHTKLGEDLSSALVNCHWPTLCDYLRQALAHGARGPALLALEHHK
ncbi:DUF3102 domain-containing protein [Bradyrhizobium sp. F1.13.3]|uniref:DUF3102 domain-containing protein n=1 Tax=Bradyrhizobium sp. F1.13.3 TaxID=3156351 RepID=UPI003390F703